MVQDEDDRRAAERGGSRRRETGRRRCLLVGLLVRPGSDHVERVGVRNISASGAKLQLDGLGIVHADTVLLIPKMEAAWEIEVIWRELPQAGVKFARDRPIDSDPQLRSVLRAVAA